MANNLGVVVNLFDIPGQPALREACVENILQVKPACEIRTARGTDFAALARRSSISLSVPSTCSRRDFVALRPTRSARATEPVLATVCLRFSALRSPERMG